MIPARPATRIAVIGVGLAAAPHLLSLCELGARAAVARLLGRTPARIAAAAAMRYPDGASASVQATTAAYPGFAEKIAYSGTQGTATLAAGRLEVGYPDGRDETIGKAQAGGGGVDPMAFSHQPHRAVTVIKNFLDAVATGREPLLNGAGALRVHRFIDRLLESAASRTFMACGA